MCCVIFNYGSSFLEVFYVISSSFIFYVFVGVIFCVGMDLQFYQNQTYIYITYIYNSRFVEPVKCMRCTKPKLRQLFKPINIYSLVSSEILVTKDWKDHVLVTCVRF